MNFKRIIFKFTALSLIMGSFSGGIVFASEKADVLFYEPFNYTRGESISQPAAAANGWLIQNENTVPEGQGSKALVTEDPVDSTNSVLDIEALAKAYDSATRYAQIVGPFNANGKKYIMISKKTRITQTGNKFIFYVNGSFADAATGAATSSNTILIQLTYDVPNNKIGNDTGSGYKVISSSGLPVGKWADVKFIIDCTEQTYNFFIDDVKVNDAPLGLYGKRSGQVVTGIHDIEIGSNRWISSAGHYYIDDLTVSALDEEAIIEMDLDKLTVSETVTSDFELPVKGYFGSDISWSSSDSNIISITGGYADVIASAENAEVELTATLGSGSKTVTKTFKVTVLGDSVRINDIGNKLTSYVFSGQKYVQESFTPNIPGLADTDTVGITSSDPAAVYDATANKIIITQGDDDKIVDVEVKVTSQSGNSVTKTLKLYIPFTSIVSFYEGFDYPSLKGKSIAGAEIWKFDNDNADLSKTGATMCVEASPDDASDLVMDTHVYRTYTLSQYSTLSGGADVMGDAVLQANIKFGDDAANQYIWYVYATVKTSSGESGKEILEFYFKRGEGKLDCTANGSNVTVSSSAFPTNEWFNLKIVLHSTANNFDVYKDNVKLNTSPISFATVTDGGTVTRIGAMNFGATRWSGREGHMYLDDIMVRYNATSVLSTEAEMLDIPHTLIYDYNLPTAGIYDGTTISWESHDPGVLSSSGKVNRNSGLGDTVVTLTATIESSGATLTKDFDVKVVNTPCYTINSLMFETPEGSESYSAVSGGRLKYMSVTKYTDAKDDNATAYAAVYSADGQLLKLVSADNITASGNIEFDTALPETEGIYVKAFIWNGTSMKPLSYSYSTKIASGATVYTIGDSTMQSYGTVEARRSDDGMTGWAQVLPLAVKDSSVTVDNKAVAGTSLLSFYNLGYIHPIYDSIKPGDYLIIQFGHNDEKPWMSEDAGKNYSPLEPIHQQHPKALEVPEWATSRKTYEQWLREYAAAARMKGAQVVFATSIYRHFYESDGTLAYSHYGYPEAMVDTAAETGTPLLDLCSRTGEWLTALGAANNSLKYYMAYHGGSDHTHLTYDGAVEVANMAINEMLRIGHPLAGAFTSVPAR